MFEEFFVPLMVIFCIGAMTALGVWSAKNKNNLFGTVCILCALVASYFGIKLIFTILDPNCHIELTAACLRWSVLIIIALIIFNFGHLIVRTAKSIIMSVRRFVKPSLRGI